MPQQRAHVLRRLRAADQHQRARDFVLEFGHRLGEHAAAVLIMAAVEPDFGARGREIDDMAARKPLQPRRPFGLSRPASMALVGSSGATAPQRRDGAGRVLMLMTARQARQRQIEQAALVLEHQPAVLLADMKILVRDDSGAPTRRASRSSTSRAPSGWKPMIAGTPRLKIPAFS